MKSCWISDFHHKLLVLRVPFKKATRWATRGRGLNGAADQNADGDYSFKRVCGDRHHNPGQRPAETLAGHFL
jgi:hypothetical protein